MNSGIKILSILIWIIEGFTGLRKATLNKIYTVHYLQFIETSRKVTSVISPLGTRDKIRRNRKIEKKITFSKILSQKSYQQ